MLVRNYGLFWSTDNVYWGKPGPNAEGTVLGVPKGWVTAEPTDFRQQIAVYALYSEYKLVYVGQTGSGEQRLFRRLRGHRRDHLRGRWNAFSWFGLIPVNERARDLRLNFRIRPALNDTLDHIEAIVAAVCEPPLNLQRGRFGDAEQYVQHLDVRLPSRPTELALQTAERLSVIEKRLARIWRSTRSRMS